MNVATLLKLKVRSSSPSARRPDHHGLLQHYLRYHKPINDGTSATISPFRPGPRSSSSPHNESPASHPSYSEGLPRPSASPSSPEKDSDRVPPLNFETWREKLEMGLIGAIRLLEAPAPVAERYRARWTSLVRTRVEELTYYKREVVNKTSSADWGAPSVRLATGRFENVLVFLHNATGWPLDKTFVPVCSRLLMTRARN